MLPPILGPSDFAFTKRTVLTQFEVASVWWTVYFVLENRLFPSQLKTGNEPVIKCPVVQD